MSFFDDSPELAADMRDVFNILYPPSPTSTTQDDWEETEEEGLNRVNSDGGAMTLVDLDGPVNDLPPLDIHETHAEPLDHGPMLTNKAPSYVGSLMGKLSRVRPACNDTGLTLNNDMYRRNAYAQFWTLPFR